MAEYLGGYIPGFVGSVRLRGAVDEAIVHAMSKRNHHLTVCNRGIDKRDDWRMQVNGQMETVTCLRCWVAKDPFP